MSARLHFLGHARVVAGLTALSRVSGLTRDAVVSKVFGASPVWSAFVTAFVLPNLFRRLFGEGALSAAFVPAYARLSEDDPEQARRLASLVAGALLVLLGGVVLFLEIALGVLLLTGAVGPTGRLTIGLAMVMLPFTALVCTSAMLGGVLQTHGRFAPPAGAPILLNLCMVAFAAGAYWGLGWSLGRTAFALAIGVVVAGVLQTLWHLRALRGVHAWTRDVRPAVGEARGVVRRMLPVIVGMGALQVGTLLDGLIAGYPVLVGPTIGGADYPLDGASAGVLFFASRLYQFPLGVFGIAIATAVFPALARAAKDAGDFAQTLGRGLRVSLFVGVPATLGLLVVGPDLAA
ncbi:MAG: lipid II flippase MurJ, partial [Planctomycetota bacterium]